MTISLRSNLSAFILSTTCLLSIPAMAQNVPTTAQPGVIIRDLEDRVQLPQSTRDIVEYSDQAANGSYSDEKVFTLNGVVLDNGTIYTQDQINALAAGLMGQQVSFADLNRIAQSITREYRGDGYMFSRVILPPQDIEGGVVHLQAIEGQISEVEVVGDYKDKNNLIKKLAQKIKSAGPTNAKEIERYLLLIDDLPGIKARSVLQPASQAGTTKIVISIEQDTVEGSLKVDNRGSKFVGQTRGEATIGLNSLLGIHERTTLRALMTKDTEELKFFDVYHEQQIGSEGAKVVGRYAITKTEPGASLEPLDVKGDSKLLDIEAVYPYIRNRQYNLDLKAGFEALNSNSDVLGTEVSEDRVRAFKLGTRFDFTDSWAGVTQFDLEGAFGVDLFDATDDGAGRTRTNGEHQFTRFNLSAIRIQDLPGDFSLFLSGEGQYSPDALLASEEFSVGGEVYGRAYDSGEIAGDSGVSASVELRYGGTVENEFFKSYQLYGYYDIGKVWNEDIAVGESDHDSLASAGAGIRFNLAYDLSGGIEFTAPLTRDVSAEGDDDKRIFFNILKRF